MSLVLAVYTKRTKPVMVTLRVGIILTSKINILQVHFDTFSSGFCTPESLRQVNGKGQRDFCFKRRKVLD